MLDQQTLTKPRRQLPMAADRPTRRSQCVDGPRPCPWVTCRYHLHLDLVVKDGETVVRENPNYHEGAGVDSCALDVAARGPLSSKDAAPIIGISASACKELYRDSQLAAEEVAKILAGDE